MYDVSCVIKNERPGRAGIPGAWSRCGECSRGCLNPRWHWGAGERMAFLKSSACEKNKSQNPGYIYAFPVHIGRDYIGRDCPRRGRGGPHFSESGSI